MNDWKKLNEIGTKGKKKEENKLVSDRIKIDAKETKIRRLFVVTQKKGNFKDSMQRR